VLLEGRKAIVTGGSTGIGKATAQRLAHEGASVCINYYSGKEADGARALAEEIGREGHAAAIAVRADVGQEDQVKEMVQQTKDQLGGLDLLVNNAGIEKQIPLLEMGLNDWQAVLQTNLTGAFLCLREAAKVMVASGNKGVVVNMSSVHQFIPWPGFAHYCASKGGMKLLMETAARELAPKQIRLVNIAPGAIVTPINKFVLDDPEHEASYLTGTTIVVDGGMSLYPKFV
jgi:glucose 1-dehydrogenase